MKVIKYLFICLFALLLSCKESYEDDSGYYVISDEPVGVINNPFDTTYKMSCVYSYLDPASNEDKWVSESANCSWVFDFREGTRKLNIWLYLKPWQCSNNNGSNTTKVKATSTTSGEVLNIDFVYYVLDDNDHFILSNIYGDGKMQGDSVKITLEEWADDDESPTSWSVQKKISSCSCVGTKK